MVKSVIRNPQPEVDITRSKFDLSHGNAFTFSAGRLIPFYSEETVPGDTFKVEPSILIRLNTPLTPFFDNLYADIHWFHVPWRLPWPNFDRFLGDRPDPDSSIDFLMPVYSDVNSLGGFNYGSNQDYLGIPPETNIVDSGITCLTSRAINLIWNEFFRDGNTQASIPINFTDAADDIDDPLVQGPHPRGKRKDIFTGALLAPQRGEDVPILGSLAANLPVIPNNQVVTMESSITGGTADLVRSSSLGISLDNFTGVMNNGDELLFETSGLEVDVAGTNSINSLRQAFQIQKFLERDNRGGTRLTEIIWAHYRVRNPDARLQRPEFLGSSTTQMRINPIAQTSETSPSGQPLGSLGATGTAADSRHGFTKSFTEHGCIIGFLSIRSNYRYQRAVPKMFLRRTRFDMIWPEFTRLGEQPILNKEIHFLGVPSNPGFQDDNDVFGYCPRYEHARTRVSRVSAALRSDFAQSLDVYHLGQDFGATYPALNSDFIIEDPAVDRVISVPDNDYFLGTQFIADVWTQVDAYRPIPAYGVPGFVDHF